MTNYAVIAESTNLVINTIVWDGEPLYDPGEGFYVVELDAVAGIGWFYIDGEFRAPPVPPKTPEEILALNAATQSTMLSSASIAMTPAFLALQLGNATDEETATAKAWQSYYRDLQQVDLTVEQPNWPSLPGS